MDSLNYREDLEEEEKNSAFTWEVKANSRPYHWQFQEKAFLCFQKHKYKSNAIRTAKYSVLSFLPLNLYEQFHHTSNLYFLLIIILQTIPEISTLPWFTLFAPLVCLLGIRASRDLVDDIRRHRSDKAINNRPCQILWGRSFLWKKWRDLCVGDVVCLRKDSIVPADLLLLASSEPSSLCYVETADIDGETNLKFRQAPTITHHELTNIKKMARFQGKVVCEEPNSRMHHFVGCLEWEGKKYPLDSGNILLRGCKIRNTDTCYGLVIYAGFDTKIMKNCGKIHLKRTKLDYMMNKLIVIVFLALVAISLGLTLGFRFMVQEFKDTHFYVSAKFSRALATESFFTFWGFLILLSVMVPMAMFVLAEFIYMGNSAFIGWDLQMYHEPQDLPAKARSTSLNDELGQVEYVFSDKTGTLTQNIMTFKTCCIDGLVYGPDNDDTIGKVNPYLWNEFSDGKLLFHNAQLLQAVRDNKNHMVQEFWRLLALCHTVMVQEEDNQLLYEAASPDEEALVTAARNFGYVFLARTQDTITVVELGQERVYQVLAMMDFNSVRKRMSVLVRTPEGSICLYTKGADTVIFERLREKGAVEMATEEALAAFAEQTLRTLCLAYKEVDEATFEQWSQRHHEASILLQNRAQALHQVYEEMEQNLKLLGATAIEDRLQDGVPDTIKCLKKGNIKVWVLTGDKQETAVNIGFACQLLSEDMLILEEKEIVRMLETYWETNNNLTDRKGRLPSRVLPQIKMAMVINGDFLDHLVLSQRGEPPALARHVRMDEDAWVEPGQSAGQSLGPRPLLQQLSRAWHTLEGQVRGTRLARGSSRESSAARWERAFVDLACRCQAVICCRVTPKQKALIVSLVKKHQRAVTLAIGDGANDVNMIKSADIGVGLAGQEGMQAVQNSDYVLAQFAFLRRLLLVHGRWSYMRVCKFLRYFFYKTLACMSVQIWFAFYSGFTAQPLYEAWFLALFNLLYATLPVLYIGLFEQDVSAEKSLELPELYVAGQKDELFNYGVFFQAIVHGTATSLVNFFASLWISRDTAGPHSFSDHQSFAVVVALSSLLSVTVEVILIIQYWTILTVLSIAFSLIFYICMTSATQSWWLFQTSPKTFSFLYADRNVLTEPSVLLVILLNVSINTLPVLALRVIRQLTKKQRVVKKEEVSSEEGVTVEPMPHLQREARARRSSYAFSHREGYANLITQGTILRKPQGATSEMLADASTSDEEVPVALHVPSRHSRRMSSFLGRKRHHPLNKVYSRDTPQPTPPGSVSLTEAEQNPLDLENQSCHPEKAPTATSLPFEPSQESLPAMQEEPEQRPPSPKRSPKVSQTSLPLSPASPLENETESQEERISLWRSWTTSWNYWVHNWQKESLSEDKTQPSSVESPPVEESPTNGQPSPVGQPLAPTEDQFPPEQKEQPPSPPEEQSSPQARKSQ
ncbi:phospholipid-transporting ATPase IK [Dasypus novemcinctus]|uniref:phospholipid-transporting ATPase IK n=1 Tax=Dasypus novemcinctus TaxID=9361 RepID=UPI00265F32C2|nr:phospholipid-transporting ATPase IK [Dasypus novemcinctus]